MDQRQTELAVAIKGNKPTNQVRKLIKVRMAKFKTYF